ncbi:MAG: hypothetical protein AB7L41_04565 [Flavobacteriaceae bacterium]
MSGAGYQWAAMIVLVAFNVVMATAGHNALESIQSRFAPPLIQSAIDVAFVVYVALSCVISVLWVRFFLMGVRP